MHRVRGTQGEWKSVAFTGLDVMVTTVIPLRGFSSGNFSANEFLRRDAGGAWGSYLNGKMKIALRKNIKMDRSNLSEIAF